jgi:hypothetical protein
LIDNDLIIDVPVTVPLDEVVAEELAAEDEPMLSPAALPLTLPAAPPLSPSVVLVSFGFDRAPLAGEENDGTENETTLGNVAVPVVVTVVAASFDDTSAADGFVS